MPLTTEDVLLRNPLFKGMDAGLLKELAAEAEFLDLRGAHQLFAAGDPPTMMYLVVTGRLRSEFTGGRTAEIGVGESVGEMGVLANRPRMARVVAMRDSRLLCLRRETLLSSLMHHPQALLALSRVVIERLQIRNDAVNEVGQISNLTIVETRPGRGAREAVRRITAAFSRFGSVRVIDEAAVDAALGPGAAQMAYSQDERNWELVQWLNRCETETDFLIYTCAEVSGPWIRRALRQADHILLLADIGDSPEQLSLSEELRRLNPDVPVDLLFRRGPKDPLGEPVQWLQAMGGKSHFYWGSGGDADILSLSRQLLGKANGLVLGGGGARGFAHIGLIRALDEMGIPLDLYGGSSMGALIAALRASGLSALEIVKEVRASFVEGNFLNDYTLPRVALIRGRRFLTRMEAVFGQTRIEDLPAPYFCVSTNITRGRCEVHRSGSLAMWVATSMAVPGVAPPVAFKGDFLADGAVINALPTDVMRAMGRGRIIASSVSTEGSISAPGIEGPDPNALLNWKLDIPRPSLVDILFRTATLTSESGNARRAQLADVYLRMPVSSIGMFQWDAIDDVVRAGYEHALRELADLRDQLIV